MRKARPGDASGNGPKALDQRSQDYDNTPAVPRSNVPQDCLKRLGQSNEAKTLLHEVTNRFSTTLFVQEAAGLLEEL